MDFLRNELGRDPKLRIMCFSGRGGEVISPDSTWRTISRDDVKPAEERQEAVNEVQREADRVGAGGFDIDAVTDIDLMEPVLPPSPVTMDDLERVISNPALVPPGIEVNGLGVREYAFQQPGLAHTVRVSTNPTYYEQNADNVELWSPGNPTFPSSAIGPEAVQVQTLAELLQRSPKGMPAA
jgi:hypothetical protein